MTQQLAVCTQGTNSMLGGSHIVENMKELYQAD